MYIIGLDIGSVSINSVIIRNSGSSSKEVEEILVEELPYRRHFGLVREETFKILDDVISRYRAENITAIAITGSHGEKIAKELGAFYEVETIAQVVGTIHVAPGVRTIISIGGQDAMLFQIGYNEDGRWFLEGFNINGPCAAGTGSFIDQQAERLAQVMYGGSSSQEHLQKILEDFISLGLESSSPSPVACRCTVFTKSDMIHLQNKGEPLPNIIAGLHYGNAANYISTIVGNREIFEPLVFVGGMASNKLQVQAFRSYFPSLIVPPFHTSVGALGVALIAKERMASHKIELNVLRNYSEGSEVFDRAEPLRLEWTVFPTDNKLPPIKKSKNKRYRGFLGIDIGSTTTKYAFVDERGLIIHKNYVPTRGRPIEVTQNLLKELFETFGGRCSIFAVATTGSGRNVVGDFLNADLIIDEITAHARGAVEIDPSVDTVFEIGGQDSKYIFLQNTHPIDFDMNKVCAAGTGSFLHELANKMKINIVGEFQEIALSSKSPLNLADRCTVFMESDLISYAQKGARREDLIAGLCYAIVYNYLNRVIGKRSIGERIMFLGGPSLNKGIVAAFERVIKKPIIVPKHREVMGAFGAALLVKEQWEQRGLNYNSPEVKRKVDIRTQSIFELIGNRVEHKETICRADSKCHNECKLKIYSFGGRKSIWGGDCGRYEITHYDGPAEVDYVAERNRLFWTLLSEWDVEPGKLSQGRSDFPVIGLPLGLHFWEWAVFWIPILKQLGFSVVLSPKTDHAITRAGIESVTAEICFPVKVFHGHVKWVAERSDMIFLPTVINMPALHEREVSFFCPLVQSSRYVSVQALSIERSRLIDPTVYLKEGYERVAHVLAKSLPSSLRIPQDTVQKAVLSSWKRYWKFRDDLKTMGESIIDKSLEESKPVWIISGRPYNLYDGRLNLQLGQHLAKRGIRALTIDMLDLATEDISDFPRMYWGFGSRIIRAAKKIARTPHLYGLHITNFSCGPDSFIEHFYRHVLQNKPALILEFDEHTAVAGILTRVEAYQNVVKNIERGLTTSASVEEVSFEQLSN
ncbi:MAG: acyl-CoA dehydratase activase [Syntrophobacterales bacterium]|nr:acyl-CoA dehydratase activase [Syntrophobacterales bacterium]